VSPPAPHKPRASTHSAKHSTTQTPFQRTDLAASAQRAPASTEAPPTSDNFGTRAPTSLSQRASDGFLINGTANNGNTTPFAQSNAFGNNRRGGRPLYNGN